MATAVTRPADAGDPTLPLPLARGFALLVLAVFGAYHWMALLEPTAAERAWYAVGIAALVVTGLLLLRRLRPPGTARTALAATLTLAAAALALLGGGMADELLRPDRWGELVAGLGRGIESLPGARVPYRGVDEWTRVVIGAGGSILVVLAAALAFWPRAGTLGFRHVALIVLVTLYAVPAVALDFEGEFLRGALLAPLVLAYLRLETLRVSDAGAAGALAVGVAVAGLVAAPALDKDEPWWDYETWALSTAAAKSATFSWDHGYGPLDWPRDGRELLRVRARQAAYWKAANLEDFNGRAWEQDRSPGNADGCRLDGSVSEESRRRWLQNIRVTIRNLRTPAFITAGTACAVRAPRINHLPMGDGTYVTFNRSLRRGDAYTSVVYTPAPTERQRRAIPENIPSWLSSSLSITLPGGGPDPESGEELSGNVVEFPRWNEAGEPLARPVAQPNIEQQPAEELVSESRYARTYALAQRLRRGARSQEEIVARVLRHLNSGYAYSETPPVSAGSLDGFLFDAKAGYCQQFSGAMALLLRMAGVPARVSTGFTSGSYDRKAREYVVRDLDAHSWVEVFYFDHGWVTFDPTPATAPARSQPAEDGTPGGASSPGAPDLGGDIRSDPSRQVEAAAEGGGWVTPAAIGGAAVALLGLLGVLLLRRRRRRGPDGGAVRGPLAELERALRRMRRAPGPGTTLQALEERFARAPAAAGYVRAVREERYSGRPATPTAEQRRALRSELARGSGLRGRLRAWWALPPRPR